MDKFTTNNLNDFAANIIKNQCMNLHQLESYNNFIRVGIKQIIQDIFHITSTVELPKKEKEKNDKKSDEVIPHKAEFTLSFDNIRIEKPSNPTKNIMLVPSYLRKNDGTYSIRVIFNILCKFVIYDINNNIIHNNYLPTVVSNKFFELPCMVKSECCNLFGMSNDELIVVGEDPTDIGGYFIINGKEWNIDLLESKLFNSHHIYNTTGYESEMTRLEIISKPGDSYGNSSELIIKILKKNNIVLIFNSSGSLKLVPIPFYIIYKLFGVFIDKQIIDYIVSFTDNENLKMKITYLLNMAFLASDIIFDRAKGVIEIDILMHIVAECIVNPSHQENLDVKSLKNMKNIEQNILNMLDTLLFPHLGKTSECRHSKIYYLSYLIFNTILVHLKMNKPTDRDSFINKRINTPGQLLAKELKSLFNVTVARAVENRIKEELQTHSINNLASLSAVLSFVPKLTKLSAAFVKSIVTGKKEIKISNAITTQNKIPSEQLIRKNNLNSIASQRTIRTPTIGASKSSERSYAMRRVTPTQIGYICPIQSADTGESVGIVKQLAIGAIISLSQSSIEFEKFLLNDEQVILLEKINVLDIARYGFAKIFINGRIVGVTQFPNELVIRYREYRRGFDYDFKTKTFTQINVNKIDPYITIIQDFLNNNIAFWLDNGRLMKPFIIVRNNSITVEHPSIISLYFKNSYNSKKDSIFEQKILLNKNFMNDNIKTLLQKGIIEYIAPGELDNMLISIDINNFYKHANNPLLQYTHVDIQCLNYSLAMLCCPYASHNQAPRLTFQTNQGKQSIGVPTLNPEFRIDKHLYYMYTTQFPLVRTVFNDLIYPNGMNVLMGLMCYKDNQEDSFIINGTASQRTLFESIEFNYIKVIFEQNEFCGLVHMHTIRANFAKLGTNFCIPKNIKIEQNDIMLAKYIKLADGNQKNTSYIYRGVEPIIVEDIIVGKNQDGFDFYKFKYYVVRKCTVGDKFSTRHGQKGSVSSVLPYYLLPFNSRCESPYAIMNTSAIPSRMTIGQLLESMQAKIAALTGKFIDGTMFEPFNMDETRNKLEKLCQDEWGTEVVYDGLYGHPINNRISITPMVMQKLQKFGITEQQATSVGPYSIITKQPLDGKANDGGLRYGEMEKDVAISSGGMHFPLEKFRENSDGFYIYVCMNCNKMATVNEKQKIFRCKFCSGTANLCKIYSTWMTKTVFHHLESSGIGVKIYPEEYEL